MNDKKILCSIGIEHIRFEKILERVLLDNIWK